MRAAAGDGDVGALPAVVVDAVAVEAALLASRTEAAGRRYKKGRNDSKRYCDGYPLRQTLHARLGKNDEAGGKYGKSSSHCEKMDES